MHILNSCQLFCIFLRTCKFCTWQGANWIHASVVIKHHACSHCHGETCHVLHAGVKHATRNTAPFPQLLPDQTDYWSYRKHPWLAAHPVQSACSLQSVNWHVEQSEWKWSPSLHVEIPDIQPSCRVRHQWWYVLTFRLKPTMPPTVFAEWLMVCSIAMSTGIWQTGTSERETDRFSPVVCTHLLAIVWAWHDTQASTVHNSAGLRQTADCHNCRSDWMHSLT